MGTPETSSHFKTFMRFPSVRFSLAAFAALVLVNGFFLSISHIQQHKQLQRAQVAADSIDLQITIAQAVLQNVAKTSAGMSAEETEHILNITLQTSPVFSNLAALPSGSEELAGSAGKILPTGKPPLPSPADHRAMFGPPFLSIDPLTGDARIYLAQRQTGGAVILGQLSQAPIQTSIDAGNRDRPNEMVYLMDDKGLILARSQLDLKFPAALPAFSGEPNQNAYSAASIAIQNSHSNSQAVVRLQNAGWYIISLAPLQGDYFPYLLSSLLILLAIVAVWVNSDTKVLRNGSNGLHPSGRPEVNASPALPLPPVKESAIAGALSLTPAEEDREARLLAEALRDTASVLNSSLNFDEVMSRILDNVGQVVPHHSSSIMLIDKDGDTVRIVASRGYTPLGMDEYSKRVRLSIRNTSTLSQMFNSGQPLIIPNTVKSSYWVDLPESKWIRSYAAAPIQVKGRIIGFLNLNSPTAGFYQSRQSNRLLAFADQAGIAIENARLLQQLQESNRELVKTYDITLQGWSKALELRDYETEGHSQRVVAMTLKIAAGMGIEEPGLTYIRYGVLLHDIGKIGIPDSILFKPGPLTDEEWKIMRMHPQYALDILASIPYLAPSIDIPYNHHERWDGTGYPRGLMGEEIPLAARIFAIVDVWDGLRQSRPYHASWSVDEAIRYIKAESGKQFDPAVVELFLQLIAER